MAATNGNDEAPQVSYEELGALEKEFDDADLDIIRHTQTRFAPLYEKREAVISKIPHFWALVLEAAPLELDQWVQPSDSQLFAESLKAIKVDRFEINDPAGSPRSFSLVFEFEENEYFKETKLEKKFWYRRSKNSVIGPALVSEPIKITWKEGKDLTKGVTDAAYEVFKAKKANNTTDEELPAVKKLVKTLEEADSDEAQSFFTFFSFVSSSRFISAEESAEANKKEEELRAKQSRGEKLSDEEIEEDEEVELDILSEVHSHGEDIAQLIAEDLYPNAVKYFTNGADDEDLSEIDDEDMPDDESDEDEPVDIRALVGKGKKESNSPPPKKRKT